MLLNDFYRLSGLIGPLISLAGLCFYLNIRDAGRRRLSGLLFTPVIYWLTGAASFVFAAIVIISELFSAADRKEKPYIAVLLILLIDILLVLQFL